MSKNINTAALANLPKADLIVILATLLQDEQVAQAPTEVAAPVEAPAKPKCSAIASSTGERCTRNATQGDTCKSHVGWDNDAALAKHAKAQEFVESRREAAKGKGPKVDNKALAAAMRALGVTPNGEPWAKAKALVKAGQDIETAALTVAAEQG